MAVSPYPPVDNQVLVNGLRNPDYCPYCLRCTGLVRMKKAAPLLWACECGAVHDLRHHLEAYKATVRE